MSRKKVSSFRTQPPLFSASLAPSLLSPLQQVSEFCWGQLLSEIKVTACEEEEGRKGGGTLLDG